MGFKVISPRFNNAIRYVSDLMLAPRVWDTGTITSSFLKEDVELIMSLCLSYRRRDDRLVWFHNDKGEYTVKSGYYAAKQKLDADLPSCSNPQNSEKWWKYFWSLKLPSKAKIF